MQYFTPRVVVAIASLALAACDSGSTGTGIMPGGETPDASSLDGSVPDAGHVELPESPAATPPSGVTPTVNLYTFNAGLISENLVKAPAERRPLIVDAIKRSDADVICIQEVFTSFGGPDGLAADLADEFPYATWRWPSPDGTILGPGLLIASRHPLYRARSLAYAAMNSGSIVDRALVAADVLTENAYFTVMCTHLQSGLGATEVALKGEEIDEALAFAEAEGYMDGITFWLGDFNAGPDPTDPSLCPAHPDCCSASSTPACTKTADLASYQKILAGGFVDPNTDALGATSSRSLFIPLQVLPLYNNEPSQRIDHCFYRGIPGDDFAGGSIVFDEDPMIEYDGPGAPEGGEILHSLSDHRGVRCRFRPE